MSQETAPAIDVVVRCLETGRVRSKSGSRGVRRYLLDRWSDKTLPVYCYLIERPNALVLFDTGQTVAATHAGYHPRWHPFFRLSRFELEREDEVAPRLLDLGHNPSDVRLVVLSHLHTDHVGGLAPFAGADVVVTRREWQTASGVGGMIRGNLPHRWPKNIVPRLIDFDGPSIGPFAASHVLAEDGTLTLLPAPGHTPGHAALLVRGVTTWLLAGDIAHTAAGVREALPEVDEWARSEGVVILTAHDPAAPELISARSQS